MTLAQPSPDWMLRAACRGVDPEVFFPHESSDPGQALAICSTCPVREECLAYAVELDAQGVWGGLTYAQRGKRYRCRGCGVTVESYRHRYCPACAVLARAGSQERYRRSAS